MTEYYFIASLLPLLEIGHVPSLGFSEFKNLLNVNLTRSDLKRVHRFLTWIDFENFRAYWAHEPLDSHGNLITVEQIEQALKDYEWGPDDPFDPYLIDYLDKYRTNEERLSHFPLLMSLFFAHEMHQETGFLRDFFAFQRDMRLVLVGFRAKKLGRDISTELQYEDPTDPIVAQILAQKDAKTYEPPFEYKELKPIFEEFADSPYELYKALVEYQFNYIIELWGGDLFSINRILNYTARLILVERWLKLDVQKGISIVDSIEREIR
jgi:hypothetical protein